MDTPSKFIDIDQISTPTKFIQCGEEPGTFQELDNYMVDYIHKYLSFPEEDDTLPPGNESSHSGTNNTTPNCQEEAQVNSKDFPLTTTAGTYNNTNSTMRANISNVTAENNLGPMLETNFLSAFGSEINGCNPVPSGICGETDLNIATSHHNPVMKKSPTTVQESPSFSILRESLRPYILYNNTQETSTSGNEQNHINNDTIQNTEPAQGLNLHDTKGKRTRKKFVPPEVMRERNRLAQSRSRQKCKDEKRALEQIIKQFMFPQFDRFEGDKIVWHAKLTMVLHMLTAQNHNLITHGLTNGDWINEVCTYNITCSHCGTTDTLDKYTVSGNGINKPIVNNDATGSNAATINSATNINNKAQTFYNNATTNFNSSAPTIINKDPTTIKISSKYNNDCSKNDNNSKKGIILKPVNGVIKIPSLKRKISCTSRLVPVGLCEQSTNVIANKANQRNKFVKLIIPKSDEEMILPRNVSIRSSNCIIKNSQPAEFPAGIVNEEKTVPSFGMRVVKNEQNITEMLQNIKRRREQ